MASSKPDVPRSFTGSVTSSSCPLLDRLPLELRLHIYGLVLARSGDELAPTETAFKDRHIRWRPRLVPGGAEFNSRPRDSRLPPSRVPIYTAFFRVCKLVYEEAQSELLSRSIVVLEIKAINKVHRFPGLLARMRRVEIMDWRNSRGWGINHEPPRSLASPPSPIHDRVAKGITHLRRIRTLLERAPLLRVIIGLSVLHLTLPCAYMAPFAENFAAFESTLNDVAVKSGFGPLECVQVGRWRTRFANVDIAYFRSCKAYERYITNPCDCGGTGYRIWRDQVQALQGDEDDEELDDLDGFILQRHIATREGFLGEEAWRRCGAIQPVVMKSLAETSYAMMSHWGGY